MNTFVVELTLPRDSNKLFRNFSRILLFVINIYYSVYAYKNLNDFDVTFGVITESYGLYR